MKALEIKEIHTYYGLSHILHGLSMEVSQGEVVSLLGRNGAGKTTTLRSIMGLTPPRSGTILFQGQVISGLKPNRIFRYGMKIVPQGRGVFPALSVEENLRLAMTYAEIESPKEELQKIYKLFPILREKQKVRGEYLSGGQLQILAISRTLLGKTKLILMDEPTEGLAPLVIQEISKVIREIKASGTTIVLAEQNVKVALDLGDRHYIIDNGAIRFQGSSEEIRQNEEIKRTYLGVTKKR
jgi:branched-chain amino acid transport system ATP-binding protein